ncbi:MAG: adenylate/guanylate cyclase protein [Ferruginibacter sp.]|nr:adenylate/guanylate cyclase protein [Ferruginibacter sp.]
MIKQDTKYSIFSGVSKYRIRRILYIALFWTAIDVIVSMLNNYLVKHSLFSLFIRECLVMVMSLIMGYLFVFTLKIVFRKRPLWVNFLAKTIILLFAAFAMNFLVHFVDNKFIMGMTTGQSLRTFFNETVQVSWMLRRVLYWVVLFVVTQLYIEINDKYSPGVFIDIIAGKYINPKIENRIVMFLDLKDSTPIAEKLGHHQYFLFIREFIFHISMALIEHGGIIYQYVGDEIVVSWLYNKRNTKNALSSIIESRKNIQKNSQRFRRKWGQIPEFRVGIHVGDVTVGEIGVIKKDLAMSGDTMNTTARIRSACNELNQKFIVSREFMEASDLKNWQSESLGVVELKGKANGIELFSLKI